MYLAPLKGLFVSALKDTLADPNYPVEQVRGLRVSIEYPIEAVEYPAIWVDYDDTDTLKKAGVDHEEYLETDDGPILVTRWRFEGYVTLTVAALTSLERDLIYDEIVGMVAFGHQDAERGGFMHRIERNDFLAVTMDSDTIQPRGAVAAPGTPWGTDEIIYEKTLNISVIGEFIPDPRPGRELLLLSEIIVKGYNLALEADREALEQVQGGFGPKDWH